MLPSVMDPVEILKRRFSYSQKAASYSRQREFRLVVCSMGKPSTWFDDDYLSIEHGTMPDG